MGDDVSEQLAQALERMSGEGWVPREASASVAAAKEEDLLAESNAPRRHLSNQRTELDGRDWGRVLAFCKGKLGTGFTVALTGIRGERQDADRGRVGEGERAARAPVLV